MLGQGGELHGTQGNAGGSPPDGAGAQLLSARSLIGNEVRNRNQELLGEIYEGDPEHPARGRLVITFEPGGNRIPEPYRSLSPPARAPPGLFVRLRCIPFTEPFPETTLASSAEPVLRGRQGAMRHAGHPT